MSAPAIIGRRPILVTGGAGFIGCNIADALAEQGKDVLIYDSLARDGVERNLEWLRRRHPRRVSSVVADVRDERSLARAAASASAVFHMAAQVAVTTSLEDPCSDFAVNLRGTVQLLETLRSGGRRVPLIFASTNKVYGDLADIELERGDFGYRPVDEHIRRYGVDESRPLEFHTPYGCSKGAADQYVLDYARSFGLPTAVLRMSCIYGQRQMGTEDQGWVAHFLIQALNGEPITVYGDGHQVRDILDVSDAVATYVAALDNIERIKGRAFNLGGGPANAVSLRALIDFIEGLAGRRVELDWADWRSGDQRYFVADARQVRTTLGLPKPTDWRDGVGRLADWLRAQDRRAPLEVEPPLVVA